MTTDAHAIVTALKSRGWTLAVAESFTGGLLADAIVAVPGASQTFLGSITAYADQAKIDLLQVPNETVTTFGAVSAETACAMAEGARRAMGATVGVSTTGIAGPTGEVEGKPLGLSFVAISTPDRTHHHRAVHGGDRDDVRRAGVAQAMALLAAELASPP